MLIEGIQLLVIGLGVVFLFLGLLVAILRFLPLIADRSASPSEREGAGDDSHRSRVAAAIAVAWSRARPRR